MLKRWIVELLRKLGPPDHGEDEVLLFLHSKCGKTWDTLHSTCIPGRVYHNNKRFDFKNASGSIAHYKEVSPCRT